MAQRQTIQLADKTFSTKKECKEFIKSILHNYSLNESLEKNDLFYITELLKRHPEYIKKAGCGIRKIIVRPDEHWGGRTRGFYIIRLDNSGTDFSYINCIDNDTRREPIKMFNASARTAVEDQILKFKIDFKNKYLDVNGNFFCSVNQENVKWDKADVDHYPLAFKQIVLDFIQLNNINPAEIEFIGFGDNQSHKQFKDNSLKEKFSEYHKQVATLRVISKKANLKRKRRTS